MPDGSDAESGPVDFFETLWTPGIRKPSWNVLVASNLPGRNSEQDLAEYEAAGAACRRWREPGQPFTWLAPDSSNLWSFNDCRCAEFIQSSVEAEYATYFRMLCHIWCEHHGESWHPPKLDVLGVKGYWREDEGLA